MYIFSSQKHIFHLKVSKQGIKYFFNYYVLTIKILHNFEYVHPFFAYESFEVGEQVL